MHRHADGRETETETETETNVDRGRERESTPKRYANRQTGRGTGDWMLRHLERPPASLDEVVADEDGRNVVAEVLDRYRTPAVCGGDGGQILQDTYRADAGRVGDEKEIGSGEVIGNAGPTPVELGTRRIEIGSGGVTGNAS